MLWSKKAQETLNWIEVSKEDLNANLKHFQNLDPNRKVAPVLKANAYGHGLDLVGKWMDEQKPPFLVLDSILEGYQLRQKGIKSPLLILSPALSEQVLRRRHAFSFALSNFESIAMFAKSKDPVHLEIDTGMNRLGFSLDELPAALKAIQKQGLQMEGLFTHLFDSDNPDNQANQRQIKAFQEAIHLVQQAGFKPQWIHASNSSGAAKIFLPELNMMRLGLGLYGVSTDQNLKPTLKIFSRIVQIRTLEPGETLGYAATYTAKKQIRVGVLPFGYYEGLPRILSNRGPFLGNICMNHSFVEVPDTTKLGDPYQLLPDLKEAAEWAETIPYELLVRLNAGIRRIAQ